MLVGFDPALSLPPRSISVLRVSHSQNIKGAYAPISIRWDQARHVLEQTSGRGLSRKDTIGITRIGVDERASAR